MRTEADDKLDTEFSAALAVAVEGTPLELYAARDGGLPWIQDPRLPDGGYWVGFGLRHLDDDFPRLWPTFIFVQYRDEGTIEAHTRPLDIDLSGPSARDGRLMAALVVTAVLPDVERRLAQAGATA